MRESPGGRPQDLGGVPEDLATPCTVSLTFSNRNLQNPKLWSLTFSFFYQVAPQVQTRVTRRSGIDDRIEMQMRNGLGVKLLMSYG